MIKFYTNMKLIAKDYFEFIDAIRETNQVNIFETPRLLRKHFDLTKKESFQIFKNWIQKND